MMTFFDDDDDGFDFGDNSGLPDEIPCPFQDVGSLAVFLFDGLALPFKLTARVGGFTLRTLGRGICGILGGKGGEE